MSEPMPQPEPTEGHPSANRRTVRVDEPADLTLAQELNLHLSAGHTPEDAARMALAPYRETRLYGRVLPVIVADACNMLRNMTRRDERRLLALEVITDEIMRKTIQERLATRAFVVDGKRVDWVKATAAQHRARAAWLELQMSGIAVTRRFHVAAADIIEVHGVQCLDEIPDYAARLAERCVGEIPPV